MPLHPVVVHFPVALSFIAPVLVLVFAYMIKVNKMSPISWLVIIGLHLMIVVSGYVALETGETDEDKVEKVITKSLIHEHEEAAEVFVGASVVVLVLSVFAFFLRKEIQFYLQMGIVLVGVLCSYLVYRAAHQGGELVYRYSAAGAHIGSFTDLNGPGAGKNSDTNSTEKKLQENESYKADEFDYGNQEEGSDDEEELKQED